MPDDTWALIASFLDVPEIALLACVSRRFGVVAEHGAILSAERHPRGEAGALQALQTALQVRFDSQFICISLNALQFPGSWCVVTPWYLQGNKSGALKCLWELSHPPATFTEHAADITLTDGGCTATAWCGDAQGWRSAVCGEPMGYELARHYLEFTWSRGGPCTKQSASCMLVITSGQSRSSGMRIKFST